MTLAELRSRTDAAVRDHAYHVRRTAELAEAARTARASAEAARTARKMLQEIAAAVQRDAHGRISAVVTSCLSAVFGENAYRFRVVFEQKRGKTEARPEFVRNGAEYAPDSVGGGVIDVAALGLRLAARAFVRPALRPLLVLDEPLRMVSRNYAPRVRALLESVAAETGVQLLIVTHSAELAAGRVVELG